MQRPRVKIVILPLMVLIAAVGVAAGQSAAVSGVVRDAQGVTQLGAMVQVITADSAMAGTTFTDLHGRYFIAHLLPGQYEVRASAALFVPAMRGNLQLRAGAQAVVNLTLSTLFESSAWLPAERRKADEPGDDWKWTLRSAANRPMLRLAEDGDVIAVSSSASESVKHAERLRAEVTAGDGGFGSNGIHNIFAFDKVLDDGAGLTLRTDIGTQPGAPTAAQSTEIATGYGMRLGLAGAARTVLSYQGHPEMLGPEGSSGLQVMQLASGQQMQFGDMVDVEAGGTIYVVRTSGYASGSRPFLKVIAHPSETWSVGYRMATSQDLQSFASLDTVRRELPVAAVYQGRVQTEAGLHQELSVARKTGRGTIQLSYYRDSLNRVAVSGGGNLSASDVANSGQVGTTGIIADATTGDFRFLSAGYKTQGLNVTLSEPLTSNLWMALEYGTGAGLAAKEGVVVALPDASTDLAPVAAQTATIALRGRVIRSGTTIRTAYRWQPSRLVSAVDPYAPFSDQAFLSCYLRQAIRLGNLLPPGLEATVDITNLLAQGYRPFLSEDGQTLFLAQSPRTMQAGLAFTF